MKGGEIGLSGLLDMKVLPPTEENWYTVLRTEERSHHIVNGNRICSPARTVGRLSAPKPCDFLRLRQRILHHPATNVSELQTL